MSDASEPNEPEIDVNVEIEVTDVDGDGQADIVEETVTTFVDEDGDGVADIVEETTTQMIDTRLFSPGEFSTPPLDVTIADPAGNVAQITAC